MDVKNSLTISSKTTPHRKTGLGFPFLIYKNKVKYIDNNPYPLMEPSKI